MNEKFSLLAAILKVRIELLDGVGVELESLAFSSVVHGMASEVTTRKRTARTYCCAALR